MGIPFNRDAVPANAIVNQCWNFVNSSVDRNAVLVNNTLVNQFSKLVEYFLWGSREKRWITIYRLGSCLKSSRRRKLAKVSQHAGAINACEKLHIRSDRAVSVFEF